MCYFIDNKNIQTVFDDEQDPVINKYLSDYIMGPSYPIVPIITDRSDSLIPAKWRFDPNLPEDYKIRQIGLNIRAEEVTEKKMFKNYVDNHCIIPINGFYEWKHYSKKIAAKHYMSMPEYQTFYLAGLWRYYDNNKVSFGILTTNSNELMSEIHNTKLRMPISLTPKQAKLFLESSTLQEFFFPSLDPQLSALNLEPEKIPNTLF